MDQEHKDITGEDLTLRPFVATYITERYLGWLKDPEVVRFSNQRFVQHSAETCLKYLESFKNSQNLFFGIFDNETSAMIGTITAYVNVKHSTADIGILIGERSVWGQGFGGKAWSLMMKYLFEVLRIRKVTGGTLSGNTSMVSIMKRSGMHLEGSRKAQEIVDGIPNDTLYFARFRDE